jgi:hypothetical protein
VLKYLLIADQKNWRRFFVNKTPAVVSWRNRFWFFFIWQNFCGGKQDQEKGDCMGKTGKEQEQTTNYCYELRERKLSERKDV